MFGPKGNPTAGNLFNIIAVRQKLTALSRVPVLAGTDGHILLLSSMRDSHFPIGFRAK